MGAHRTPETRKQIRAEQDAARLIAKWEQDAADEGVTVESRLHANLTTRASAPMNPRHKRRRRSWLTLRTLYDAFRTSRPALTIPRRGVDADY
jgi:hypothetical protein